MGEYIYDASGLYNKSFDAILQAIGNGATCEAFGSLMRNNGLLLAVDVTAENLEAMPGAPAKYRSRAMFTVHRDTGYDPHLFSSSAAEVWFTYKAGEGSRHMDFASLRPGNFTLGNGTMTATGRSRVVGNFAGMLQNLFFELQQQVATDNKNFFNHSAIVYNLTPVESLMWLPIHVFTRTRSGYDVKELVAVAPR